LSKKIIVIGSGFAGLATATCLADRGYDVTVLEKNSVPGGRARQFKEAGFTFDMGPSWYWMPEVFDEYFELFGKKTADYYDLKRLDPSYSIYFGKDDIMKVPAKIEDLYALFELHEPGSSDNLKKFLKEAQYKYQVGMNEFVFKPGHSIFEFADARVLKSLFRLQLFQPMSTHVRKLFKNEKLIKLLEFPVLFLGATPQNTPALYSLMNYADLSLGTWYPMGGMFKIIEAMVSLADYHHVDQMLLEPAKQNYNEKYWDKRTMAPSSLLFYLGVNKKIEGIKHHNLFFDESFEQHATEIYENPQWPSKPLFYVCCPSKTDDSVAPEGHENLFLLIPLAPDLKDEEATREKYYNIIMDRLEDLTGQKIREHVVYKRSFAHNDFKKDYHAYKGNAYGLANTLFQTAFLKPKLKNKKVKNLYYAGQLTTPGPGVPPSLISGQVVATEIDKQYQ